MFTVAVNLPTEKFAAMQAQIANLAQPDGPLDAVGSYVSSIGMPGYFRAGGDGWAPVLRGGTPLIDDICLVAVEVAGSPTGVAAQPVETSAAS